MQTLLRLVQQTLSLKIPHFYYNIRKYTIVAFVIYNMLYMPRCYFNEVVFIQGIILFFIFINFYLLQIHTSVPNLRTAWTASRRVSKDDWMEWLKRLSIGLLKESPSPALR